MARHCYIAAPPGQGLARLPTPLPPVRLRPCRVCATRLQPPLRRPALLSLPHVRAMTKVPVHRTAREGPQPETLFRPNAGEVRFHPTVALAAARFASAGGSNCTKRRCSGNASPSMPHNPLACSARCARCAAARGAPIP